jgi:nitrous oxidase accessory protein NosD
MEHRAWYRRRAVVVACALVLAAGAAVTAVRLTGDGDKGAQTPAAGASAAGSTPSSPAPEAPIAKVCGTASVLDGPTSAPAGAVSVSPSQNLDDMTEKHPGGTTFWLTPGVHALGAGAYNQVIPKNGNTYIGAPGAVLDGARKNRYAFTGYAVNVTVKNLTIQNFGAKGTNSDEGVVNHDSAMGWVVEHNTIQDNAGAGVMLGSRNVLRGNCLTQNGQYGFNSYNPHNVTDITIDGNEIADNNTDNWEKVRPGCGCTGGGKFWMTSKAVVKNNWVHDNRSAGLWADTNNSGFLFENNYLSDNDSEGILYEASYNAMIRGNTFVRNGKVKGPNTRGFPTGALYVSESGSDSRVPGPYNQTFEITGNVFTDNWAGVLLWENADRFSGSPANTSTDANTLVNPGVVTAASCNEENIEIAPYLDDCRWKTKNVRVHDNLFSLDPDKMGRTCATRTGCGYNGLFSNWGTFPQWSPYQKTTIQDWITFKQGNRFFSNTYAGPWHFVVHGQGTTVNWPTWQGAPYSQDKDSVVKVLTPGGR